MGQQLGFRHQGPGEVVPHYIVSLPDELQVAGAVLSKALGTVTFVLAAFAHLKLASLLLELLLQHDGHAPADALQFGQLLHLLLNAQQYPIGPG